MADRGFTVFNVIDHSGVAERAGVQMPDSKLVMFGKPTVGATVMLAAPLAALNIPLKVLVWQHRNGAVSVSYNSPGFLASGTTLRTYGLSSHPQPPARVSGPSWARLRRARACRRCHPECRHSQRSQ
jgi:uncharacterized protein (DUF302 family)